jgi:hypothetical protein
LCSYEWHESFGIIMSVCVLNTGHTYGNITDIMEIIKTEKKGKHINTVERYHICKISKHKLHMNDTHIESHNPIFEILQEIDTR